jgi:hypothetical protein
VSGVARSTTPIADSTTTRPTQHWDLLKKQHVFWKVRSQSTTTWAFFAPNNTSCWQVNSSASNQSKQLKCFFCTPKASARLWNDIIIYKTTNGIFAFQKHFKSMHWMLWIG